MIFVAIFLVSQGVMYVNESVFADFTDITLVSNDTYRRLWQVRILMTTITMRTTMNMHA